MYCPYVLVYSLSLFFSTDFLISSLIHYIIDSLSYYTPMDSISIDISHFCEDVATYRGCLILRKFDKSVYVYSKYLDDFHYYLTHYDDQYYTSDNKVELYALIYSIFNDLDLKHYTYEEID